MHCQGGRVRPKALCQCSSFSILFYFFCANSQSLSYPDKHPMLHLLTLINSPPPAFYLILKERGGIYPILSWRECRFNNGWQLAFSGADEKRNASQLTAELAGPWPRRHLSAPVSTLCPQPRAQTPGLLKLSVPTPLPDVQRFTSSDGREQPDLGTSPCPRAGGHGGK